MGNDVSSRSHVWVISARPSQPLVPSISCRAARRSDARSASKLSPVILSRSLASARVTGSWAGAVTSRSGAGSVSWGQRASIHRPLSGAFAGGTKPGPGPLAGRHFCGSFGFTGGMGGRGGSGGAGRPLFVLFVVCIVVARRLPQPWPSAGGRGAAWAGHLPPPQLHPRRIRRHRGESSARPDPRSWSRHGRP